MRIFSSLTLAALALAALATLYLFARVPAADRRANAASFDERFTFSGATTTPRERSRRITLPSAQFDEPYNAGMFLGIPARAEERA